MKNSPTPSADIRPNIVRLIMDLFLSGVDLKRSLRAGKTERRDAFATDASSSRSNMEICSAVREWEANFIRGLALSFVLSYPASSVINTHVGPFPPS